MSKTESKPNWTDGRLDELRRVGDPLADEAIDAIAASGEIEAVRRVLRLLVDNDHPLDVPADQRAELGSDLYEHLRVYFERSDHALPRFDPEVVEKGQRVFALHGPEILMILCCYSLPAAYAAAKGVQVLAQTGRLESHPKRRLFETTQMVVDVLSPGGLSVGADLARHGKGIRTTQKVRLMHAAIRHLILERYGHRWVDDFGVPINQEDMAGTLMTFSWIVLDGLDKIGARVDHEHRQAYLDTWRAIASVLGLRAELVPEDLEQAQHLTELIQRRQIAPSDAGDAMARALVDMMRDALAVRWLRGFPPTMIRHFLGHYADVIDLPPADWTTVLVGFIHDAVRAFDGVFESNRLSKRLYRRFNLALIDGMLRVERGGNRAPFDIPDHLAAPWGLPSSTTGC